MTESGASDVVVIGAGIVGCATAYFMAKAGLRVTLVEKGDIGGAVSGASLACVGGHMVSREELPLLLAARALWQDLATEFDVDMEYRRCGQLRFVAQDADLDVARGWIEAEQAAGATVAMLTPPEVRAIVPALQGEIFGATWSSHDAVVNPFLACRAFATAAGKLGVRVLTHTEATAVKIERGRVTAVVTREGALPTAWVVNASGPWAARVAHTIGIEVPIRPRKAQCLATVAMPPTIPCVIGACESAGGIEAGYTQIQQAKSGQVLFNTVLGGTLRQEGEQDRVPSVDHDFVIDSVRTLLWLFPALAQVDLLRSWVRYEAVTPDDRFIVGPVPDAEGFLMAAGDCGTGFTRAPMIGRLLAELVTEGRPSMPIDLYSTERFGAPQRAA
jgi:glycine/D-amino acid oxidase-like deaminating enzyme